jgi:endonuclease III
VKTRAVGSVSLGWVVERLRGRYGPIDLPPSSDPFELILWENIACFASPAKKRLAFEKLRSSIGTRPQQIMAARERDLREAASFGILRDTTVAKLRECARIAVELFAGDVRSVLAEPLPAARTRLRAFPAIGKPGADRVLMFADRLSELAPESNGIRVLGRLGLIPEGMPYQKLYESARAPSVGTRRKPAYFKQAHLLLQLHGRTLCRRHAPLCSECPLAARCHYARGAARRTA